MNIFGQESVEHIKLEQLENEYTNLIVKAGKTVIAFYEMMCKNDNNVNYSFNGKVIEIYVAKDHWKKYTIEDGTEMLFKNAANKLIKAMGQLDISRELLMFSMEGWCYQTKFTKRIKESFILVLKEKYTLQHDQNDF
jgi:hypothetical protein